MTITRVVEDGVEFFTLNDTGESGMSISGIARLCGVDESAVRRFLAKYSVRTSDSGNPTRSPQERDFQFGLGGWKNIKIVPADVCAVAIEYYAYESRRKTPEALFAFRKFAKMGIDRWIQSITGWVDPNTIPTEPPPLPDINLPRHALDILKSPNDLTLTGYRLYLQIHEADILNLRLTPTEACKNLQITLPTYHKALKLLDQLSLLPSWVITKSRRQPERLVRDWLRDQIGGQTEAPSPDGPIDLLTDEEVVEVKAVHNWKEGIGHVLVKAQNYPDRHKCLLLFGEAEQNLTQIEKRCAEFDIQLGFIPIVYTYDETAEEVQIELLD